MSATTRSSVDLPQPDGPSNVRKLPGFRLKLMSSNATTSRCALMNRTVTPRSSIAGASDSTAFDDGVAAADIVSRSLAGPLW